MIRSTAKKACSPRAVSEFPFSSRGPEKSRQGRSIPIRSAPLDVAATAVAQAGIEAPTGELDGIDLLPYLSGKITEPPARKLYWRWTAQAAIRDGDWKFIKGGPREYLFNISEDMQEKRNLIQSQPEIAQRLKADLESWSQSLIPAGLSKGDLRGNSINDFDYYLDGKPAPDPKSIEDEAETEKPQKKKRKSKTSPPAQAQQP